MNTAKEKNILLQELVAGDIDIVIGTHALLQPSVKYKNLGLVIIDEEHRFGVRQKEHFKSLRADVDILSLSATPIPRTLSMAVEGLRQLSLISTPPPSRLAVKTVVAPFSHAIVTEACERELLRGGQVYFIHNEIRDMERFAEQLAEWLPEAAIVIAHGGMGAGQLNVAMRRFLRRQANILLCTTIVESGLDIHNANTIVIERADRMGISRLHQLRGRVGRSHQQAYAYFLTPPEAAMTKNAEDRLSALRDYSMLGGGFFLAMRDLEIRGAGEILGERQSGDCARSVLPCIKKWSNKRRVILAIAADTPTLPCLWKPGHRRYYRRNTSHPPTNACAITAAWRTATVRKSLLMFNWNWKTALVLFRRRRSC